MFLYKSIKHTDSNKIKESEKNELAGEHERLSR